MQSMTVSYMDDYKKNIAIKRREEDVDDNDNDKEEEDNVYDHNNEEKKKKMMAAGRRPPASMRQAESGLCMCGQPSLKGKKPTGSHPTGAL
jgi:hypothetical protein